MVMDGCFDILWVYRCCFPLPWMSGLIAGRLMDVPFVDVRVDCWPIDGCPVRYSVLVVLEPVDVPLSVAPLSRWMSRCPPFVVLEPVDVPLSRSMMSG